MFRLVEENNYNKAAPPNTAPYVCQQVVLNIDKETDAVRHKAMRL